MVEHADEADDDEVPEPPCPLEVQWDFWSAIEAVSGQTCRFRFRVKGVAPDERVVLTAHLHASDVTLTATAEGTGTAAWSLLELSYDAPGPGPSGLWGRFDLFTIDGGPRASCAFSRLDFLVIPDESAPPAAPNPPNWLRLPLRPCR